MNIVPGVLPLRVDRKFHLAAFVGTHAQILLRSGRSYYHDGHFPEHESVFDVLFKNVGAIAIWENFYPLEVAYASSAEIEDFLRFQGGELGRRTLYTLRGAKQVGYVLASSMYWTDDPDGSVGEESILVEPTGRAAEIEVMEA
ncbi:hypothetical protein ACFVVM_20375 [Nocardia sp. NPDC058176]|uniref:hypothetical protein n=1 Tax=Nocardia sp. NPDC058176 TaxID=3346368 RepID=UPI0036DF87A2